MKIILTQSANLECHIYCNGVSTLTKHPCSHDRACLLTSDVLLNYSLIYWTNFDFDLLITEK